MCGWVCANGWGCGWWVGVCEWVCVGGCGWVGVGGLVWVCVYGGMGVGGCGLGGGWLCVWRVLDVGECVSVGGWVCGCLWVCKC